MLFRLLVLVCLIDCNILYGQNNPFHILPNNSSQSYPFAKKYIDPDEKLSRILDSILKSISGNFLRPIKPLDYPLKGISLKRDINSVEFMMAIDAEIKKSEYYISVDFSGVSGNSQGIIKRSNDLKTIFDPHASAELKNFKSSLRVKNLTEIFEVSSSIKNSITSLDTLCYILHELVDNLSATVNFMDCTNSKLKMDRNVDLLYDEEYLDCIRNEIYLWPFAKWTLRYLNEFPNPNWSGLNDLHKFVAFFGMSKMKMIDYLKDKHPAFDRRRSTSRITNNGELFSLDNISNRNVNVTNSNEFNFDNLKFPFSPSFPPRNKLDEQLKLVDSLSVYFKDAYNTYKNEAKIFTDSIFAMNNERIINHNFHIDSVSKKIELLQSSIVLNIKQIDSCKTALTFLYKRTEKNKKDSISSISLDKQLLKLKLKISDEKQKKEILSAKIDSTKFICTIHKSIIGCNHLDLKTIFYNKKAKIRDEIAIINNDLFPNMTLYIQLMDSSLNLKSNYLFEKQNIKYESIVLKDMVLYLKKSNQMFENNICLSMITLNQFKENLKTFEDFNIKLKKLWEKSLSKFDCSCSSKSFLTYEEKSIDLWKKKLIEQGRNQTPLLKMKKK